VFDFRRSSAPPQEASQPAQRSGLTASEQWPNGPARSHQIHKLSTSPVATPHEPELLGPRVHRTAPPPHASLPSGASMPADAHPNCLS
jgi:hypothetical protein